MATQGIKIDGYNFLAWPAIKDPDSNKDYSIDWSDWLLTGRTIVNSTWTISPVGSITIGSTLIQGSITTFWASGGTAGVNVQITNRITDSDGRVEERTKILVIEDT